MVDNLLLYAGYFGLPRTEAKRRTDELLAFMALEDKRTVRINQLSGGMRKRAAVARAIVRKPDILLYDEPTTGLDPIITNTVNELIIDMREKLDVTTVIISHDIPAASRVSDNFAILHAGKILESGTPEEVMSSDKPEVRQFLNGETSGPLTDNI